MGEVLRRLGVGFISPAGGGARSGLDGVYVLPCAVLLQLAATGRGPAASRSSSSSDGGQQEQQPRSHCPPLLLPGFQEVRRSLKKVSELPMSARILYVSFVSERGGGQRAGAETATILDQHSTSVVSIVRQFLSEEAGGSFSYLWIATCCMPPNSLKSLPHYPSTNPVALACADAVLIIPPMADEPAAAVASSLGSQLHHHAAVKRRVYSDLRAHSVDLQVALDLPLALIGGSDAYIYFYSSPSPWLSCFLRIPAGRAGGGGGGGGGGFLRENPSIWNRSIEEAVGVALLRLREDDASWTGGFSALERSWQGMILPSFLIAAATKDVHQACSAQGALCFAIRTLAVTAEQSAEHFSTWDALSQLRGKRASKDELCAALNLLLFCAAFTKGFVTPLRGKNFERDLIGGCLVDGHHLDLWMRGLSPLDLNAVLKAVGSRPDLRKLTVGSNATGGAGVGEFLLCNSSIREVELEWEGLREVQFLGQAIASHPNLVRLNLTHNRIDAQGALHLARGLRESGSLTELDLRENNLGCEGVKNLMEGIGGKRSVLRSLNLQDNGIGDNGAISVTECLFRARNLNRIMLDGNCITDVGGKLLTAALRDCEWVAVISLSRNRLSNRCKALLHSLEGESRDSEESVVMFRKSLARTI